MTSRGPIQPKLFCHSNLKVSIGLEQNVLKKGEEHSASFVRF